MATMNQPSFPEYILVTFGSYLQAHGAGNNRGYYGLFAGDQMVLKKASTSAVEVIYTETGISTPSNSVAWPGVPPTNRIKLRLNVFITTQELHCYGMNYYTVTNAWTTIAFANSMAKAVRGWGTPGVPTGVSALAHYGDATYTFLDAWNHPDYGALFKTNAITTLEEYLPDLIVSSGTGGTVTVSEENPRYGEEIIVTATSDYGYSFSNWSLGSGGRFISLTSSYTFNMPFVALGEAYELYANFVPITDFRINGLEPVYA